MPSNLISHFTLTIHSSAFNVFFHPSYSKLIPGSWFLKTAELTTNETILLTSHKPILRYTSCPSPLLFIQSQRKRFDYPVSRLLSRKFLSFLPSLPPFLCFLSFPPFFLSINISFFCCIFNPPFLNFLQTMDILKHLLLANKYMNYFMFYDEWNRLLSPSCPLHQSPGATRPPSRLLIV